MNIATGGPEDFGRFFPVNLLKQMQEMMDQMNAPARRLGETMRRAQIASMAPIFEQQKQLFDSISRSTMAPQRELMDSISKQVALNQPALASDLFESVLRTAGLRVPTPSLMYLAGLGSMANSGQIDKALIDLARSAVEEQEGLAEAINDFSVGALVLEVFDVQTIKEGTYIFVFISWFVLMLIMTGHPGPAEQLADMFGFTGVGGTHPVARKAAEYVEKRMKEQQSGEYPVDGDSAEGEESGPNQT